jgi:hypothetical protein
MSSIRTGEKPTPGSAAGAVPELRSAVETVI